MICSLGSNWLYGIICSDNGLAPIRQQAIIWTNDGLFYWRIYATFDLNELISTSKGVSGPQYDVPVDFVYCISLDNFIWDDYFLKIVFYI